jgi:hypothetical protein
MWNNRPLTFPKKTLLLENSSLFNFLRTLNDNTLTTLQSLHPTLVPHQDNLHLSRHYILIRSRLAFYICQAGAGALSFRVQRILPVIIARSRSHVSHAFALSHGICTASRSHQHSRLFCLIQHWKMFKKLLTA